MINLEIDRFVLFISTRLSTCDPGALAMAATPNHPFWPALRA